MPNDNAIKFGILKTRDLVELYYGARMVVTIKETHVSLSDNQPHEILQPDPRRIRYELRLFDAAASNIVYGSEAAVAQGTASVIPGGGFAPQTNNEIVRDWWSDGEAVCLGVTMQDQGGGLSVSVRETFLTPIPVDETP